MTNYNNVIHHIHEELKDRNLTCFMAREYGSTANGTDGPDSDTDVQVIFYEPTSNYILEQDTETFDVTISDELELDGWSVKKFFRLLRNSNPTAIEFLQSDIVHYENSAYSGVISKLEDEVANRFNPVALFYHNRSKAENNYMKYIINSDRDTVKKNLFVVDALARSKYILERDDELPPLNTAELFEATLDGDEYTDATELLAQKRAGNGDYTANNPMQEWVESMLDMEIDEDERNRHMGTTLAMEQIARGLF